MRHSNNKEYLKLFHNLLQENKSPFLVYKQMVNLFYSRHNRYPTALEFKHDNLLPNAREIQRNHGGLKKFREDIGLEVKSYSSGQARSIKLTNSREQSKKYEIELFERLHKKLHNPNDGVIVVLKHTESRHNPVDDKYTYITVDIEINKFNGKDPRTSTYIEFFYATTPESFYGCVNIKNKKIKNLINPQDIIFVSVNPEFTKDIVSNIKLPKNSPRVLSYDEFVDEFGLDDTTSLIMETMA